MRACVRVCMYVFVCVCAYVCVRVYVCVCVWWYYLPTPPLGQDMTQGQFFLSGVEQVLNSEFSFS